MRVHVPNFVQTTLSLGGGGMLASAFRTVASKLLILFLGAYSMGLGASLLSGEPTTTGKKRASRTVKVERKLEWLRTIDEFQSTLLDPSFLTLPLSGNTLETAKQYPQ